MKILAICETSNFKEFTRRATFEAISRISGHLECLVYVHLRKVFRINLSSTDVSVIYRPTLIPKSWAEKSRVVSFINKVYLKIVFSKLFKKYSEIILSSPPQIIFRGIIPSKCRRIVILSDPFHLMGYSFTDVRLLLDEADIVFATSINLKNEYCKKYFGHIKAKMVYWPNTVDMRIWGQCPVTVMPDAARCIVGYIGNISYNTVDLDVLDFLSSSLELCDFTIAGKIEFQDEDNLKRLELIFNRPNVNYLGYVKYEMLCEEIMQWSVGLCLDSMTEISSYCHHNKVYQYLACGLPVVATKVHKDYETLSPYVALARDKYDFLNLLKKALYQSREIEFREQCRHRVFKEDSTYRAKAFFNELSV